MTPADEGEIRNRVLEDWQFTGGLEPGWTITDAAQPRFTLSKGRTAQAKKALEHFTAPVREALSIPEFKHLHNGRGPRSVMAWGFVVLPV